VGQTQGQSAAQTGEQAAPQIQRPAIDLSWEPDLEPRVAGYRVYRRDLDGDAASVWQQLGSELMPMAAYRDLSVVAGRRYAYRVTAVSEAGNESAPSGVVVETAPVP
jgi:fibronectin type 3 domain-containing protein